MRGNLNVISVKVCIIIELSDGMYMYVLAVDL